MIGRRNFQPGDVLSFGPFSLFVAGRLLKRADETIPLGGRALDVLIALTEQAGEVVSYRELISIAWPNVTVDEANLRVQIATLRRTLSDGKGGARYISNVAGRGYCFARQSNGRNTSSALHLPALSTPMASRNFRHACRGWLAAKTPFGPCRRSLC
jgi:DNA-binding winged helix-turn-helix (wHTH) protein